jgi:hypothetical protein
MAAVSKLADIEDTIERLRQQLRNIEDSQAVETEVPADAATGDALSDALRVQRRSSNTNSSRSASYVSSIMRHGFSWLAAVAQT